MITKCIQPLESRILFAGAVLTNGTLEITGTVKADTIYIIYGTGGPETLSVRVNKAEFSFAFDDVTAITVLGGPNDDYIAPQAWATDPGRFKIPTTILGSSGNDLIIGTGARDRLVGGTGDDKISGGFARDIIYGEDGYDTLDGGGGNDYIRGGAGSDRIFGDEGTDQLYGDSGHDRFFSVDLQFRVDNSPFLTQQVFDLVDGGSGTDQANSDSIDRLLSIESEF